MPILDTTVAYTGQCHIPDIHVLAFPDQSVYADLDANEGNHYFLVIRRDIRDLVWMNTQLILLIVSGVTGLAR